MSGILGTNAALPIDINLILQIAVLLLLVLGLKFERDGKLFRHGVTMSSAVILHLSAALLVMFPSFIRYFGMLTTVYSLGVIITWAHVVAGLSAMILGIYIVAMWRFQTHPKMNCASRKRLMKPTLVLWILTLILGISFYVYYYVK